MKTILVEIQESPCQEKMKAFTVRLTLQIVQNMFVWMWILGMTWNTVSWSQLMTRFVAEMQMKVFPLAIQFQRIVKKEESGASFAIAVFENLLGKGCKAGLNIEYSSLNSMHINQVVQLF